MEEADSLINSTWTGGDAHALRLSIGLTVEDFATAVGVSPRTVAYWSARPSMQPRRAVQALLDGFQQEHLEVSRSALPYGPSAMTDHVQSETDRFIAESVQIMPAIGPDAIEILTGGVRGLAQTYNTRTLFDEFDSAAALQRQAVDVLHRTARPNEIAQLFITIAQLGALMASCAFDLGRSRQAFQLSAASLLYAERGGDRSLAGWILGLQASLHLWGRQPARALELIDQGIGSASAGQPQFRLCHIGARAAALAGDRGRAVQLLHDTEKHVDVGADWLADDIGGEFHFDSGRAAACAAATWLVLADWPQVMASTERAVDKYREAPGGAARVPMLGSRLDLASAMVQVGDVDAAECELGTVFAEAGEHRYSLVARVEQVADQLGQRKERRATILRDTAFSWLSESV